MKNKPIAIACDTEFTSFDKIGGDLLSMAFVEILEDLTLGRSFIGYCKPRSFRYFTAQAQEIHGFSYWKAIKFPDPKVTNDSLNEWLEPIKNLDLLFIYQGNGLLDWRWMIEHLKKTNQESLFQEIFKKEMVVSTLPLARKYFKHIQEPTITRKDGKLVTKYSLPNIAQFLKLNLNHHEVLSDAITCAKIWIQIKIGDNNWTGDLFE